MSRAGRAIAALVAAGAGIAAAASVLHARDARHPLPVSNERLLYLRSGRTADRVFLSFDAIASDVYWIRTIQHYGGDFMSGRTTGRFELLDPLLDLTTTLDPRFNIAYRFGAIFLAEPPPKGPGRADEAIALLEKGIAANPTRWQYMHDIGFVHYWFTNDYEKAADAFERAAAMPGAPEWLRPVAAMTRVQGGDRAGARRLLTELLSADQAYVRHTAERGLQQLQALDAIDRLQAIVERYHEATGAYPRDWRDLVAARLLRGLPLDPTQAAFVYDAAAHRVTISEKSSLWPLPKFPERRAQ
jgi:tetratricopeptide (TPR) repeat protein